MNCGDGASTGPVRTVLTALGVLPDSMGAVFWEVGQDNPHLARDDAETLRMYRCYYNKVSQSQLQLPKALRSRSALKRWIPATHVLLYRQHLLPDDDYTCMVGMASVGHAGSNA